MAIALSRPLLLPLPRVRAPRGGVRTLLLAALLLLPVVLGGQDSPAERRLSVAVGPHQFDLVSWELRNLAARAGRIGGALVGPVHAGDSAGPLSAYFGAPDVATRALARGPAEVAIDAEITREALAQGLGLPLPFREPLIFPPASTWVGPPPQMLIVSPRDRIEVQRSVLLDPDVSAEQSARAEGQVDGEGLSALVVPIGGLSTYPAMVLHTSSSQALLSSAAHEWAHGYLFFRPLGQSYFASYEGRAINETVADLFGRELGERIATRLDVQAPPPAAARPVKAGIDFVAHMRETRRKVDRQLAAGRVNEAEAYMEQRRLELAEAGFSIRKLNQAYFAFYGSYTEGPATASYSPIPDLVRRLRQRSSSLGEFLRQASTVRTVADLARVAGGG